MNGPLAGVRVLDLTHVWAGPLSVRFLADLGAEVVKVESPFGRGPRNFPYAPLGGWIDDALAEKEPWNANAMFLKLNRNRRSLCVDLKQSEGREAFLKLVAVADVVIENFSARAMPAMDLGFDVLRAANPKIVYVTMPGYGASGVYKDRVAFGPTVESLSGLTQMLGYDADSPRNTAMALMDPIGATHAAAAVVTALRQRDRDGEGKFVEMSLHEGGVAYSGPWLIDEQLGLSPTCMGNRHPNMAPHGVFPCLGDDRWVAIACATEPQWQSLSGTTGVGDAGWPLMERRRREDEIESALATWTRTLEAEEVAARLQSAGVPAGLVATTPDYLSEPQAEARSFFVAYEPSGKPLPGNPVHMAGLDSRDWQPCPRLGAHNAEILRDWLGFEDQQVETLEKNGVLFRAPPA